jgi:Zn-dependent M16 (insulinase) family peptidase
VALGRTSTYFSTAAAISSRISGLEYYFFLKKLLANWESRKWALSEILPNLADRIFTADEVTVSFTGSADDRARFWEAGGTLGLSKEGTRVAEHRLELPPCTVRNEGFIIPTNVSFVARGASPTGNDPADIGSWQIATRALSFDYLWNEIRVKGGAYGVGVKHTTDGLTQFWSYRDPNLDSTLTRYDGAAAWLEGWQPNEDELTGYVVSSVASHDAPVKPRQLARRQDVTYFSERPDGWRNMVRQEMLETTAEKVRSLAGSIKPGDATAGVCVFGPREALEASGLDLEISELIGGDEQ